MELNLKSVVLLLFVCNVITFIPGILAQDYPIRSLAMMEASMGDRDKRALDFGTLVRNLLMKSAYASNSKAALSRNLINLKTTTTTTTTTTPRPTPRRRPTTLAPFFGKKSFLFPFDFSAGFPFAASSGPLSGGGGAGGGIFNFDYDYMDQSQAAQPLMQQRRPMTRTTTTTRAPPPTTTTTTTTVRPRTTQAPPRLPAQGKPLPQRQQFSYYDYYDDDYDYGAVEPTTPATGSSPPSPSPPPPPSSQQAARPRRPQQNQVNPLPLPPPRSGARQDRPFRLRNPALYQYAQTNDFSTNNNNGANAVSAVNNAASTADNNPNVNNNANDDTSQDTNEDEDASNAPADNEAALNPNITEDQTDSSDNSNSNPNTNGNGSNGNEITFNGVNNNNELPAPNTLFDYDNVNAPPLNNGPSPPGSPFVLSNFGSQFSNPGSFLSQPQLNQPYGLDTNYQNAQYPGFNDYSTQYRQLPSSPVGFFVRHY